ncbi:unnamed protein product, partial [Brachionus calyciflorus]
KEIPDEDCIKITYNIFNKNIRRKLRAQFSFIVKLFNDCIAQGDYIEEWKCAIVTPLYKKGDMDSLNN